MTFKVVGFFFYLSSGEETDSQMVGDLCRKAEDEAVGSGNQCEEQADVAAIQSGYIGSELVVSLTSAAKAKEEKRNELRM